MTDKKLSLGIDFGTSGIRAMVLNQHRDISAYAQIALPESQTVSLSDQAVTGYSQEPSHWWRQFKTLLALLDNQLKEKNLELSAITDLAIDGTSGTVLLCDQDGQPCSQALMYNDQRAAEIADKIARAAPLETAATGATSGLAKLIWLFQQNQQPEKIHYAANQADWILGMLLGHFGISDHNNTLKMGYDAIRHCWPDWLMDFLEQEKIPAHILPEVFKPGEIVGKISSPMAQALGFQANLNLCAGTTDSTAAIIASGASKIAQGITSLGSSLVMKVIANKPVFNREYGIYSQPFGSYWLVGGSSNSGGAVLKYWFCPGDISDYTEQLNKRISQGQFSLLNLSYYPLLSPGERFPVSDAHKQPVLEPRPNEDIAYFQAMLEGMADIEALSYQRLQSLGVPYPEQVISMGGGSFNRAWQHIREQKLGVNVILADQEQAAFGSAILAQTNW
jgi:sugar (pentulose or hexulose) kinase